MSLMRAFTTRRNKPDMNIDISPNQLGRAASQRGGRPVLRSQISGPVGLVSTTNMLSYDAPDIVSASSSSDEDSDTSVLSINTSGTVTDASSIDNSPTSPDPEPNHLSCYFKPAVDTKSPSLSRSPSTSSKATFDAPAIPRRVPSHSKKAHEHLHRKRSVQRYMSSSASIRDSADMFSPSRSAFVEAPQESPFGNELAQLDEVAEELGGTVRDAEANAETLFMESHSLAQFSASEYLSEIQGLINAAFESTELSWV